MDAFATVDELGLALNRVFDGDEQAWIQSLLEDASTYLRDDVCGQQIFPQTTSTFTVWPDAGRIELPQHPVISVDAVEQDAVAISYTRRDATLTVDTDDAVDVTFTFGYAVAPASLKRWACVLVSQVLVPLEQQLGLTAAGLSSIAVDDFKAAFADAGESTGITLSERNVLMLQRQFGSRSSYVVNTG